MEPVSASVKAIFDQAAEIASAVERQAFLDQACAQAPELRQQVEALLKSYEDAGSFLETPAADIGEIVSELHHQDMSAPTIPEVNSEEFPLDFLDPPEKPGQLGRLDHYEVLEVIGRGGMGVVLKAFDQTLHRVVAIKVLAPALATSPIARSRFIREAIAAAAVRNEHVVGIHAVAKDKKLPYLVMEYIAGVSVQDRLEQAGPLAVKEILRIGMQTAAGLAAAHAQGLVHRDTKPANILLENGVERVKITDFGLARAVDDASLTQSGVVAGTPQYMAPEQAGGEAVDHRADLFSLGSVLYAMCTGRPPFRASGTLAILKRVCEDTPRPVREVNPDIPEWLAEIIAKLHAKNPAERYQTATEVQEILSKHLADLQASPGGRGSCRAADAMDAAQAGSAGASPSRPRSSRRRWAIAAAVLLGLAGVLGLTEATGVTQLVPTVIRVLTPDGTLVVEVDDPGVKVTIEGDGGIVITGAGPQEVRLKPGSYKVRATKDGKLVRNELVTVSRGDKQVVRVSLEPAAVPPVVKAELGAFVVLDGKGSAVRKYDTLAEAVQGAADGDTIEVRGNGPFITKPIDRAGLALVIRAGAGFRPVIKLSPETLHPSQPLLSTRARLVLEGLELQVVGKGLSDERDVWQTVLSLEKPSAAYLLNCRLLLTPFEGQIISQDASLCKLQNCELIGPGRAGISWYNVQPGQRLIMDNSLQSLGGFNMHYWGAKQQDAAEGQIQLTRSTFLADRGRPFMLYLEVVRGTHDPDKQAKFLRFHTSGSIFDGANVAHFGQLSSGKILPPADADAFLGRLFAWQGERNLYAISDTLLGTDPESGKPVRGLADWRRFWGSRETDSIEGRVRYQGGDIRSKMQVAPEKVTPDDFRLRPDSAGYRAGKDGKDLGADIDLVGPGKAYERWKKTPEYQKWLKDTGQKLVAAPPEPRPFVLLGAKGVEIRQLDTLAEAVQAASDGDTIEIRGNGPFATDSITISRALTIRAGEKFRPIIKLSTQGLKAHAPLLATEASLVLEGLEFQRIGPDRKEGDTWRNLLTASKALHIANCRFLIRNIETCIQTDSPICELRNSELLCPAESSNFISPNLQPGQQLIMDNCLVTSGCEAVCQRLSAKDVRFQFTRNTFRTALLRFYLRHDEAPNLKDKVMAVEASGNVFDVRFVLYFEHDVPGRILAAADSERALARLVAWKGERNLYAADGPFVSMAILGKGSQESAKAVKSLAEWKQFWRTAETNSIEGRVRYQGGDLLAKLDPTPQQLTPEDWRLRPDSAGYRAGKDGKDLGADIDLVGPGPAYERWKKTPEYQQWLRETRQK